MTSKTRQEVIEESNRQIAMRAIASAARGRRLPRLAANAEHADAAEPAWTATVSESAFARLVAELEATSQAAASERQAD